MLGSTGSIGKACLDVAAHLPDRLQVVGISAHSNWRELVEQSQCYRPRWVTLTGASSANDIDVSQLPGGTQLLRGADGVMKMVTDADVDMVLSAIVGSAGLEGTWAALEAGKSVAVANKETLVMAGQLVMELARRRGASILPVDSEHSAVFQAIQGSKPGEIERIVLTASGGPFRGKNRDEIEHVSVDEALRHPTWRMGPKITIDSATLMNKSLEVIEAHWLFGLSAEQIDVIIHPESVIHSFVEFKDGSVLAQLSPPDMRLPIQYALTYPDRVSGPATRLAWRELRAFHFEPPNHETFPAIQLGYEVVRRGGTCGAVLNAANEAAVGNFLEGELAFADIARACRAVLDQHDFSPQPALGELIALDRWARQEVGRWISQRHRNRTAK